MTVLAVSLPVFFFQYKMQFLQFAYIDLVAVASLAKIDLTRNSSYETRVGVDLGRMYIVPSISSLLRGANIKNHTPR